MKDGEFQTLLKYVQDRCCTLLADGWGMCAMYELAKILKPDLTDEQAARLVEGARNYEDAAIRVERKKTQKERNEADDKNGDQQQ